MVSRLQCVSALRQLRNRNAAQPLRTMQRRYGQSGSRCELEAARSERPARDEPAVERPFSDERSIASVARMPSSPCRWNCADSAASVPCETAAPPSLCRTSNGALPLAAARGVGAGVRGVMSGSMEACCAAGRGAAARSAAVAAAMSAEMAATASGPMCTSVLRVARASCKFASCTFTVRADSQQDGQHLRKCCTPYGRHTIISPVRGRC